MRTPHILRIGVLWGGASAFGRPYVEAARRALGELGYVEGRDSNVEYRFGESDEPGATGGNITGMTFLSRELAGKRLEILKEAVPGVSRVAARSDP